MPNKTELYMVTHSSPELETVGDYLNVQTSPAFAYNGNSDKFLSVVGKDKKTNRERIIGTYNSIEKKRYANYSGSNLPLKVGTLFYIEAEKLNTISFATEGIKVVSTDEAAFKASKLAELESDKGYFQVNKPVGGEAQSGTSKQIYPDMTVWIWCRALSSVQDESTELKGQFFDLTPFIQKITACVGKNGGNFNITLPPLVCDLVENKWVLREGNILQYLDPEGTGVQDYVAESSFFHDEETGLVRNQFLFHNIIKSNDLIMIRFETLEMDKDQRYEDSKQFYIDKKMIAGRIYDMIGLVDSNVQVVSPESNEVSINITGRDLSKLLIEDGTYFYALENSQGMLKFAGQSTQKNSQLSRIFAENSMSFFGLYSFTSIEYILKFIIQQLSTIKIVPQDLFESYGDRRNKRYDESDYDKIKQLSNKGNQPKHEGKVTQKLADGIWQIVDLVIDKSVSQRRLADSSLSTANGSLLNFIHSACQEPLVEFYMDTYGDKYYFIVRQPPYNKKGLLSLIQGRNINTEDGSYPKTTAIVDIDQEDVLNESLMFDDSQVYSWYHFFPRNAMIGGAAEYSLQYLGALYFEEYAQIFGSKPFQQSHTYIPYVPIRNKNNTGSLSIEEQQAVEDLKYVVESNQYLPFSRKGSFVLNGDRRIKIGNVIRYKSTGEIFFVDSVTQSFVINENKIDRTTIVSVSRGLVEQLIYGTYVRNGAGALEFVSYFNIINTDLNLKVREYASTKEVKTKNPNYIPPVIPEEKFVAPSVKATFTPIVTNPFAVTPATPATITPNSTTPFFNNSPMVNTDYFVVDSIANGGMESLERYKNNRNLFIGFINAINRAGYWVRVTSTQRSYQEQWQLKYGKGGNLNNAEPGHSHHEHNEAIDINIVDKKTGKVYKKQTSEAEWRATGVPAIANSLGLRWGGKTNDGKFGTYVDRVHFEASNNISDLQHNGRYNQDEFIITQVPTTETGVDRESIFSNFKVNKFVFNFFLKGLQMDSQYRTVSDRFIDNGSKIMPEFVGTQRTAR